MVLPISFSCFIVIIAQSAATSRTYALRYRDHFNQNMDLIGLRGRALSELHQNLEKAGVVLALIDVQVRRHGDLERMGLIKTIGANRIFETREACVAAYRSESTTPNGLPPERKSPSAAG
jgi:hypothetical protein